MSKIAVAKLERTVVAIAQVASGNDTERADGRERARFGTTQPDLVLADSDPFAVGFAAG